MERPKPQSGTQNETTVERVLAKLADTIIIFVISLVVGVGTSGFNSFINWFGFAVAWGVATFVYHTALEATFGQTLGKRAVNVVVVKENGDPCDWGASTIRNLVRVVDSFPIYLIGMVAILLSGDDQRLGDMAASTFVTAVAPEPDQPGQDPDFLIELHHDEPVGDKYVELTNESGEKVDLSRGTLRADSGAEFRFPQGETVHSPGDSKTFLVPEDFRIEPGSSLRLLTRSGMRYDVGWNES